MICHDIKEGKRIAATGHAFDQEVEGKKYLKREADCTHPAEYYKSCKCGESSKGSGTKETTFDKGKANGHNWDAWTSNRLFHWRECVNEGCNEKDLYGEHEWINAVTKSPLCTSKGILKKTCKMCRKMLEEEIEEGDNHLWKEPLYTWANDNSAVTATRTCRNNSNHKESETVKTTSSVMKDATYTTKGQVIYTARFKNVAFKTQTKKVSNISELPKKANTMILKANIKRVKSKKLKIKAVVLSPIKTTNAQGNVKYQITKANTKSRKALKLNVKTGKITVKRKTKKGVYKLKVKVTAAGNRQYDSMTKSVAVIVKVR